MGQESAYGPLKRKYAIPAPIKRDPVKVPRPPTAKAPVKRIEPTVYKRFVNLGFSGESEPKRVLKRAEEKRTSPKR